MMKLILRNYQDEDDYWRIRQFLREVMLLNGLREWSWGVARLDYWHFFGMNSIHPFAPLPEIIFLWETSDGKIAAVLNPEDPGNTFLQVHPSFKTHSLEEEMILLAEQRLSINHGEKRWVAVWADSQDELRLGILKSRGFVRGPETENQWRRDLDGLIPKAPLAAGYTIRCLGEASEIPARSWASWRGFHPDEPEEKYQGCQWYSNIQRCPLYRRDLDLLAAAPDGSIASFATFWFDDATRTTYIEPVATVPEHLRKGLARAVITEGLRHVQRMGAVRAFVGGMEAGPNALYSTTLSPDCDVLEQWVKEW
jgi:mycothiol synthase